MKFLLQKINFWLNCARYHALGQSFFACLVVIFLAFFSADFDLKLSIIALFGVSFAHLSVNLFDDFFDYLMNKDLIKKNIDDCGKNARFGKCLYLFQNKISPQKLLIACISFAILALFSGLIIFSARGYIIVYITIIAGILGLLYSAPPLKLSYRGLGEIITGLMFGPLLMFGVYFSATGSFNFQVFVISIAVGLLVSNILYIHSMLDLDSDKAINKTTLAVFLTPKYYFIALYFFMFGALTLIVSGVFFNIFSKFYLLVLFILPLYFVLINSMKQYEKTPRAIPKKYWYMGIMEHWNFIKNANLEWFMIRWYLSRNILVLFCVIIIIARILENYV